jgi:hypothetical protein
MELLLNLFWLLLVVPALWVWHKRKCEPGGQNRRSPSCLLILGCVLMLLFPVVSATDDLQAMRPEMEEAGTRGGVGHSHHGRFSASPDDSFGAFALPTALSLVRLKAVVWGVVAQTPILASLLDLVPTRAGRAPPPFFLG